MRKRVTFVRPAYGRPGVTRRVVGEAPVEAQSQQPEGFKRGTGIPSIEGSPAPSFPPTPTEGKEKHIQVTSLLEQASKLTKDERQQLLDQLALTNQLGSVAANNRDLEMWSQAVHEALGEAIGASGGDEYGLMLVKRSLAVSACWRPVERFMQISKLAELRVVERQAIYFMLARMLVEHAAYVSRKSGAPLSPKLVGSCTGSLPGVFDASFPGYLAAGLAPMIAKQMQAAR